MIWRLAWSEFKVLIRDPFTLIFTFGLPLVVLLALGLLIGNEPDIGRYRGLGAVDYYLPAYLAMMIAAFAWISVPRHIAGYRERGVLRRYRAEGMSPWRLIVALGLVVVVLAMLAGLVFVVGIVPLFGLPVPDSPVMLLGGILAAAVGFAAIGIALGVMFSSAQAAGVAGVALWAMLLVVGGAGVPRVELSTPLQRLQDSTPVWHAVKAMQEAWFGLDAGLSWAALGFVFVLGIATATLTFRLE